MRPHSQPRKLSNLESFNHTLEFVADLLSAGVFSGPYSKSSSNIEDSKCGICEYVYTYKTDIYKLHTTQSYRGYYTVCDLCKEDAVSRFDTKIEEITAQFRADIKKVIMSLQRARDAGEGERRLNVRKNV